MCSSLSEARHRDSRNWSSGADIEIAIARFAGCTVRVQVFDGQRFSVKSGIAVHGGALKIVAGGFNARSLIFMEMELCDWQSSWHEVRHRGFAWRTLAG